MFDFGTLIALVLGAITALATALLKTRRRAARAATQTLQEKDENHANDISNAVAISRADRRRPVDADSSERMPAPNPVDKHGWRD